MPSSSATVVRREPASAAVSALVKWMRARSAARPPQLLADDSDDLIYLLLSLRRSPSLSRTNPLLLPLPHPLFDPQSPSPASVSVSASVSVCLFAPDASSAAAALDRARALSLPVSDAIPLPALRSDFRPFESRRRLCASHDLFVADRRVLPLLPRLLGKSFFRKKKIPLPLDLSRPGWPLQLRRLLRSTFLYLRSGTCCALKVGRLSMAPDLIVDNAVAAADAAAARLPRKWADVRSLHLKAVDSVALPIYQVVPGQGLKIDVPDKDEEEMMRRLIRNDSDTPVVDLGLDGTEEEEEEEEVKEKKRKRAKKDAPLELETGKERRRKKKKKRLGDGGEDSANADDADDDIAGDEAGADEPKTKEKKKIKKTTKKEALSVKKRKDDRLAAIDESRKEAKPKKVADTKAQKKARSKAAVLA